MKKRILVAPLNWGIGHACRCIPIIKALIENNFDVVLASDHEALMLLQKEFPFLDSVALPGYNVSYSTQKKSFKSHLIKQLPKIYRAIQAEHKATQQIITEFKIDGILSDNRLGVYSKHIPSIFITHQLNVLSGNTTFLSSKLHELFIKKFNECWVPDFETTPNLSGKLSHHSTKKQPIPIKFIGALSRFFIETREIKTDILVVLSGPEPQRSLLADKLIEELKKSPKKIVLVKGIIEQEQTKIIDANLTIYNFLNSEDLQKFLNESELIICRSGYTSIMDLAKLKKKVFFIPTPGQFEQEYLAEHLQNSGIAPYCPQKNFSLVKLNELKNFSGFTDLDFTEKLDSNLFYRFR
ncbi:glycosyltransferase family protein [Aurantibacter aestuarii]|uniref:Glycosyltransferase n=1 Tax=Aurantibacter aestuarii TaxID=1266046 RepID=A0A2T1NC39_9FLAO|nr:glycosyltransferase family protein [Aurantibacter aestuarii]PSG89984.1 glycosyltransferase [Aurantibacter aestuarii]